MNRRKVKFGVTLPQFGASWAEAKECALAAEEVGFDAVWVADHFLGVGAEDPLEAWTEMSAVAAITRRIEIGFLVLCNSYRPPALLAKMAATFDTIAEGRLILGYGAGWFAQEYEAYGYEFPSIRTRLEQLEEGLEILKRMWTEETPTFHGVHYHIENARCWPKPVRAPHPPILIGGGGEKILLKLVARYANIWNNLGIAHGQLGEKLTVLRAHCERLGRSFEDIEISQQTIAAIGLTRDEANRRTEQVHQEVGFLTGAPSLCPTGMPNEIIERIKKNVAMGITTFIMSFGRHVGAETLRLFGKEVIAAFRS
ncbi:MAG TPA: TIGR03560 family F420-dependent LLM class oxidoreductase [Candidatus Binatia bacterium]|nr:TIGR03560 family F420-dependent LLM class oxidoreductase [Candidatus Binatia bacterium]